MQWVAQWIWLNEPERRPRNVTAIARRSFELPALASATLAITADSRYRLFINGQWVEDGPCRSWPRHYQYDVLDVANLLRPGRNVIAVVVRHFGCSTFHHLAQEAGLLAQLDVTTPSGSRVTIGTDASWKMRVSPARLADTCRVSIQMEPMEWYDATREITNATGEDLQDQDWPAARGWHPAEGGPWGDLHPRDVRFLTCDTLHPERLVHAVTVADLARTVTFDLKRLCYPDDRTANLVPIVAAVATVIGSERDQEVRVRGEGERFPPSVRLRLNGQDADDGRLRLRAGENLLTLLFRCPYGHGLYDFALGFQQWEGLRLRNPCDAADPNPWAFVNGCTGFTPPGNVAATTYDPLPADLAGRLEPLAACADAAGFAALAAGTYAPVPTAVMFLRNSYMPFVCRRVTGNAHALVANPAAMFSSVQEWATVKPPAAGGVELCFDFGREAVGWVEFELTAPAGVTVDGHLIEYMLGDRLQHTGGNRNGFRYVTREGLNYFVSQKRRAGRYLFLTLRDLQAPVRIRLVRLLEATYPVVHEGLFRCSDPLLNRIWEISAQTVRLCMEDTYTDCPLYEQTLWIGDARNESLYNAILYGADDLTLRCLRLGAQSLDTLPLVGSQVPSGWDVLLPAWSFLWGLNVWEYYFSSGDRAALEELYPAVIRNLRGAEAACPQGLFSLKAWNLLDWAGIDWQHRTVLHNSLLLVAAIDAARRCAATLGRDDEPWLAAFRERVVTALLPLWDPVRGSYPDAVRDDGTVSPAVCQHNSALALLAGVLPPGAEDTARRHLVSPPPGMTRVGSPFALQFLLEALERCGDADHAVDLVRSLWADMLECGATTCWETFRGWEAEFPTRSHCHAWSAAPVSVFSRLLLGLVPVAPGAARVDVSPHLLGLTWAEGAVASPHGALRVAWRLHQGTLSVTVNMPPEVAWTVRPNPHWKGVTRLLVNGTEQPLPAA